MLSGHKYYGKEKKKWNTLKSSKNNKEICNRDCKKKIAKIAKRRLQKKRFANVDQYRYHTEKVTLRQRVEGNEQESDGIGISF